MFAKLKQKTIDEKASPSPKVAGTSASQDGHQRADTTVAATPQAKSTTPAPVQGETPLVVGTKLSASQLYAGTESPSERDGQEVMSNGSSPYRGSGPGNREGDSNAGSLNREGSPPALTPATQKELSPVPHTSTEGLTPVPITSTESLATVQEKFLTPSPLSLESPSPMLPVVGKASSPALADHIKDRSSPSPQLHVPIYDGEAKEAVETPRGQGEADDESAATLDKVSHEDLVAMFLKQRHTAQRYKGRFTEIMDGYKKLEREHDIAKADYTEREKKLNRKLAELREVHDLDRQAKIHMEETMRLSMEEKDEKIQVLTTQIRLLKDRQSSNEVNRDDPGTQQLKQKVSDNETTLTRYKDALRLAKEKILQLQKERDTLISELKTKTEKLEHKLHLTADATDGSNAAKQVVGEAPGTEGTAVVAKQVVGEAPGTEGTAVVAKQVVGEAPGTEGTAVAIEAQQGIGQGLEVQQEQLEKKLEESRSSSAQLERMLQESRASSIQLEKKLMESNALLSESRVLNGQLEKKLEESRSSSAQLERMLQESRASSIQLEKGMQEEMDTVKAKYESILLQLRDQNSSLQKDMKQLEDQVESYEREMVVARQALDSTRAGFERRSQLTDEANQALQTEVILLREQVSHFRADLEASHLAVQDERGRLTKDWEAKMALSLMGKDAERASAVEDQERKHCAALLDRDTKHRKELSSVEERHRKASQLLQSQLHDRQTELGNLTLVLEHARSEIISLQDQITSGTVELQKYKMQVGMLEGKYQELEKANQSTLAMHEGTIRSLGEEHHREMRAAEERWSMSSRNALEEQVRLREEEKATHTRERDRLLGGFEQQREGWVKAEAEHREVVGALEAKVAGLQSENRAVVSRMEVTKSEGEAAIESLRLEMEALVAGKDEQLTEVAASLRAQVGTLQASQHVLQAAYDDLCREHTEMLSQHGSEVRAQAEALEGLRGRLESEVQARQLEGQACEARLAQATHSYQEKESKLCEKLREQRERVGDLEAQLGAAKSETVRKVGELETAHCSRLKELEGEYEVMRTAHGGELDALQTSLQAEREHTRKLAEEQRAALNEAQSSHRQEMDDLVNAHQEELRRLVVSHSVHLKEMEEAHASLLVRQEREAESAFQTRLVEKESELGASLKDREDQLSSVERQLQVLKEAHSSELATVNENNKSELNRVALLHEEALEWRGKLEAALASTQGELAKYKSELAHSGSRWASEKVALEEKLRASQSKLEAFAEGQRSSLDDVTAKHMQVEETLKHQLEESKEAMIQLKAEHEKQLGSRDEQHQVAMTQLKAEHEKQLGSRDEQHQVAMTQLKAEHEKQLGSTDEQHKVAMTQLKAEHEKQLGSRDEQHKVAMTQLKAEHEKQLGSRDQQHKVAMNQLKAEHEKQLGSRDEQHQVAMTQLKAEHEKQLGSTDEQHQVAMTQLKAEHEKQLGSRDEQHQVAMTQLKAEHEKQLGSRDEQHQVALTQLKAEHEQLLTSQTHSVAANAGKQAKEIEGQWKDRARKLREELKKSMAINSELEAKVANCESRVKEAEMFAAEVQKYKETTIGLEASLKAKEGELAAVVAQLASSESQAEEKRLELKKKAEAKIAALKKQLTAQQERQQLEQTALIEDGKGACDQLTKENTRLRDELDSLHKTLQTLKGTAASCEEELCTVRRALETKEGEVRDLVSRAGGLDSRAQAAEKRLSELEQECIQLSRQLTTLKATAESLQKDNSRLGEELAEKESLQRTLNTTKLTLEDQVQNLCCEKNSLQATLKQERQYHEDDIKRLRREVEDAERLCQVTEEEWKGRLDKVLVEVNLEREKLIQEHKKRLQEALSQTQVLQDQMRVCQENCDEAKTQLESARREGGMKAMSDMELQLSRVQEESKAKLDEVNRRTEARIASVVSQWKAALAEQSAQHRVALEAKEREMAQRLSEEQANMAELRQELGQKQEELDHQVRLVQDTGSSDLAGLKQMLAEARANVQMVKEALAAEEEKSFKLEERLADVRSKHESDMDALKQYNKQQLSTKVAEKTAELRVQYEEAVSSLQEKHSEELRQRPPQADGGGSDITGLLQLQSLVRRCKDELQTKESECLKLKGENQSLKDQLQRTSARVSSSSPATPTRPDTPSKHVVLDSEPHGSEFEYFKNVLFQYMMGKQSKQLVKAIATLARFSDKQKGDLYSRLDV